MKTLLLALSLLLCTFAAKAQYVTIPDPAFALFLQQTYPNCMNGNQMDTTCSEIVSTTQLFINQDTSIQNVYGVQYFDNVTFLKCGSLPNLTTIPHLPPNLYRFECRSTSVASFPTLPSGLKQLRCSVNKLTSLPTLPDGLIVLDCIYEPSLQTLPPLPSTIKQIMVSNDSLVSLPNLPDSLEYLEFIDNFITTLPALPSKLKQVFAEGNLLTSLPSLPSSLYEIDIDDNLFTTLSVSSPYLTRLDVSFNQLTTILQLPPNLLSLSCNRNQLTALPTLPSTLTILSCNYNNLTALPPLPLSIKSLGFDYNQVSVFPQLPSYMAGVSAQGNNISYIDKVDTIKLLNLASNPLLSCLPSLGYVETLNLFSTGVNCLPNYSNITTSTPSLSNLPLCAPYNINNCVVASNISGTVYVDNNANCAFEQTDSTQTNIKLTLWQNGTIQQQALSVEQGLYSFNVSTLGNYTVKADTLGLPFKFYCPVDGSIIDTLYSTDSIHTHRDFALQCETGFDLAAYSVASAMVFRPANNTVVDINAGDLANFYSASCAQGVSGVVTVTLNGPITYISPAANAVAPSNVSSNVLTWNVADFGSADALNDFNIIVQTDTFAQSGQQACFEVNVTPLTGDNDTSNNHLYYCFNIVNSYDPNDKTAYPSGNIDTTQEWLTYRVRFQNTGNAEAQHIYIMDTLDANVKVETFQLLSYSHQPNVQIKENIVRFNFPFINLPDSFSNEPGSHGYVQYKVKLKDDLPIGTTINNTAYIYFDFNPPVVTNTATNTIAVEEDTIEVGIRSVSKTFDLLVYPNPANQQVTVTTNTPSRTVSILDAWGRVRLTQAMNGTSATINIADLPSGVYFISAGGNTRKKLVKL